jgi:hypothetical protein
MDSDPPDFAWETSVESIEGRHSPGGFEREMTDFSIRDAYCHHAETPFLPIIQCVESVMAALTWLLPSWAHGWTPRKCQTGARHEPGEEGMFGRTLVRSMPN